MQVRIHIANTLVVYIYCNILPTYACMVLDSNNLLNWYDYQNQCLDSGNHILYGKNLTGIGVNVNYYWTPIFRTQQIMEGTIH